MKRCLVTGGTGFVGANLVRRLLRDGHAVHLIVRPEYAAWRINEIRSEVRLHELHLHDLGAVTSLVNEIRPDWIFHLAAHGAYSWQAELEPMVRTNVQGTMNLVTACLKTGFEALVNTGSSSEYGFKDHAPAETEPLEPNSHYAVTKASATLFCRYTAQSQRLHLPTLRLYSVYGPYEDPRRFVPALIRHGLTGQLPPLVDPHIARDFVYVDDAIEAYLLAATVRSKELGPVYNVGTGIETTIQDAVAVARQAMNIAAEPVWNTMPNRQWDTHCWRANIQAIQTQLHWSPHHAFADGLGETIRWAKSHPHLISL